MARRPVRAEGKDQSAQLSVLKKLYNMPIALAV